MNLDSDLVQIYIERYKSITLNGTDLVVQIYRQWYVPISFRQSWQWYLAMISVLHPSPGCCSRDTGGAQQQRTALGVIAIFLTVLRSTLKRYCVCLICLTLMTSEISNTSYVVFNAICNDNFPSSEIFDPGGITPHSRLPAPSWACGAQSPAAPRCHRPSRPESRGARL